jgi:DNA-binding transcriptional MerR regulator
MRSDAIPAMTENSPLAGAAHYRPPLPQVTLAFEMPSQPLAIAEMADLFGVTHRTLHFYEEKGLITARRSGSMRVYDHVQIHRMAVINACREIGIPVAVIQELMEELVGATSETEANEMFHNMLARRKRELTADISNIRRQMQQIESLLVAEEEDQALASPKPMSLMLSDIEKQCLGLMAEGYSAPRLARALNLEFEDLRRMEDGIIQKFQATNRFQAVAKAMLLGFVPN